MAKKRKTSDEPVETMEKKVSAETLRTAVQEFYSEAIKDPIVADEWKRKIMSKEIPDLTDIVYDYLVECGYDDIIYDDAAEALTYLIEHNELDKSAKSGWDKIIAAFDEYCYEDEDFVSAVCGSSARLLYDQFRIAVDDPQDPIRNGYKMVAMVFITTYTEIVKLLMGKRERHPTYMINIANRLEVGYSNRDDEDDEKNGNIMIYLRNINHKSTSSDDYESKMTGSTREFITNWNQENMIYNPDDTARISANTRERLKKLDIQLGSDEVVFPIFITVYDQIISTIKIWRREKAKTDMLTINWCSCFQIKCIEQDTGEDKITLIPSIEGKTDLKSDRYATAIYE